MNRHGKDAAKDSALRQAKWMYNRYLQHWVMDYTRFQKHTRWTLGFAPANPAGQTYRSPVQALYAGDPQDD